MDSLPRPAPTMRLDTMYHRLPPELVRAILLPLRDDRSSLHSCLLVGWCFFHQAVRLLYKDPLRWIPSSCEEARIVNRNTHDSPFMSGMSDHQIFSVLESKSYETFGLLIDTLRKCVNPTAQQPPPTVPYVQFINKLRTAVVTADFMREIVPHCPYIDHVEWAKTTKEIDTLVLDWYRQRGGNIRSAIFLSFQTLPTQVSTPGASNLRSLRIHNTLPRNPFDITTAESFNRIVLAQPRLEAFELATSSPQTLPVIGPSLIDALIKHRKTLTHLTLRTYVEHCEFTRIEQLVNLQLLDLHGAGGVNDENMIQILRGCPHIVHLDLAKTKITVKTIQELSKMYRPALTTLLLENMMKLSTENLPLAGLAEKCPNLSFVDISYLRTTAYDVHALVQHCRNLEKLIMHRLKLVEAVDLFFILNSCPLLSFLDMVGMNIAPQKHTLVETHHLRSLILLECKGLTDSLTIPILRTCERLAYIDWSSTKITLATIAELVSRPRLSLKEVILEGIHAFKSTNSIFPLARLAATCPHITHLDVATAHTTSEEIRCFIMACPRVQTLMLDNCLDRISQDQFKGRDDSVWDDLPDGSMAGLTYLSLRGWDVSDKCRARLFERYSGLHSLFFYGGLDVRPQVGDD
ncbi:hypothetical protein BC938DRAFT_481276 [Jimgerdemannia flammicorona]|uniref:F-box domain-containing protein n=1 Tax=Jimgerdemannia flammicorona TaxID=994334 RepID=A0A433QGL2_9FUNG|nr:hypothetical protein BC938DRAFT_481276 [Jimgerdemannia flammicorona]